MAVSIFLTFFLGGVWLLNSVNLGYVYGKYLHIMCYLFLFFLLGSLWSDSTYWSNEIVLVLVRWVVLGYYTLTLDFLLDSLNFFMFLLVFCISMLVMVYSWSYMEGDPLKSKFMAFLGFFTFFMLILVNAGNLLFLFMGWEGVGISSYLLISFWYTRLPAVKAAVKAMIVNRIGDVFLLAACIFFLIRFDSVDFLILKGLMLYIVEYLNDFVFFFFNYTFLGVLGIFLFIGAMSKSAQLGLHTWLPDAMEGPTPVSALIHAATMVTAGVYLVLRFSFLYEHVFYVMCFIIIIGGLTCFLPAILGAFQYDIKKIVAYSTCSQLGYMFFSCGFSNYHVAFFHLVNHGFFKALLFLSMGSVIHALNDEQDLRKMGNSLNFLVFTFLAIFIGSFALLGFPFFSGYYSKDLLLELTVVRYHFLGIFIYWMGIFGAFFTAFYSTRLVLWVFFVKVNAYRKPFVHMHDSQGPMFFVMLVLMIFSIFFGYMFSDVFVGVGSLIFSNTIFLEIQNYALFDAEFGINILFKFFPLFFSLFGIFSYLTIYNYFNNNNYIIYQESIYFFFSKVRVFFFLFFFDNIYNKLFSFFMSFNYYFYFKYMEKGFFEWLGFSLFNFMSESMNTFFNSITAYMYFHLIIMAFFIYIMIFYQLLVILGVNILILVALLLVLFLSSDN